MAIRQLSLTDFRNLASTTIDFHSRRNLILGDNGSGKTSLLEAIHVLCQAQSFRTNQLKHCIRHHRNGFLLFGRFSGFKAGLARTREELEIRIDGEVAVRRSDLVRKLPVNVINAESFLLIDGAPAKRRAYLDWALFHVEHDYPEVWRRYQHALRQRNRLLRDRQDYKLLDYWDEYLAQPASWLEQKRKSACQALADILRNEMTTILGGTSLELVYRHGWRADYALIDMLRDDRSRDQRAGYTHSGIHRDDLVMSSDGLALEAVLSRGQGKRVCVALILAVLRLVQQQSGKNLILLVDDLNSELDATARQQVMEQLSEMPLQLFITNIDSTMPEAMETKDSQVFHVEHGTIRPRVTD